MQRHIQVTIRGTASLPLLSMSSAKVYVRVRGLKSGETSEKIIVNVLPTSSNTVTILDPLYFIQEVLSDISIYRQSFSYSSCFGPLDGQEVIYERCGRALVEDLCLGFNAAILAYGQTSSGKTHSLFGTDTDPGLLPRCCTELFNRAVATAKLTVSFIEIYNEKAYDLLSAKTEPCKVRESSDGAFIPGLIRLELQDDDSFTKAVSMGLSQRSTGATLMNSSSSRSHAIFTIYLEQSLPSGAMRTSKLSFCDLAGSEKASATGAKGERLVEAGFINKSLSTLGEVLKALSCPDSNRTKHIPFRNSLLTWLLRDTLSGNSKVTFLGTVSPLEACYTETMSTLRYMERVKAIVTTAKINESLPSGTEELVALKRINQELMDSLASASQEITSLKSSILSLSGDAKSTSPADDDASESVKTDNGVITSNTNYDQSKNAELADVDTGILQRSLILDSHTNNSTALTDDDNVAMSVVSCETAEVAEQAMFTDYTRNELVQALISSKLNYAEVSRQLHMLHLHYRDLEREYCATKLRLASIVTDIDVNSSSGSTSDE